jgi:hypothetical protein
MLSENKHAILTVHGIDPELRKLLLGGLLAIISALLISAQNFRKNQLPCKSGIWTCGGCFEGISTSIFLPALVVLFQDLG